MRTHVRGALGVEEEVEILFRNGQIPADTTFKEVNREFRRRWKTWILRCGWVPRQEIEDIISDAQTKVYKVLGDPMIPVGQAIDELEKALNCFRTRTWRRFAATKDSLTLEEFEISAHHYLKTEPQRRSNREQEVEEFKLDLLELLRKTWRYLELSLDCLSDRDKSLFFEFYGLGHLPPMPIDLTNLSRNARNVALFRARDRFLKSLRQIVSDALLQGADEDRPALRELLDMIETGSLKHLLAFRRQTR